MRLPVLLVSTVHIVSKYLWSTFETNELLDPKQTFTMEIRTSWLLGSEVTLGVNFETNNSDQAKQSHVNYFYAIIILYRIFYSQVFPE